MRRTPSVDALIPPLYLKGISTGDFSEALAAMEIAIESKDRKKHRRVTALTFCNRLQLPLKFLPLERESVEISILAQGLLMHLGEAFPSRKAVVGPK
jgi:hypothetical protein